MSIGLTRRWAVRQTRRIPRNFCLADKETTVEQFQQFLRANPRLDHPYRDRNTDSPQSPQVEVSWYDAAAYCNWLSKQFGLKPVYRLKKTKKDELTLSISPPTAKPESEP